MLDPLQRSLSALSTHFRGDVAALGKQAGSHMEKKKNDGCSAFDVRACDFARASAATSTPPLHQPRPSQERRGTDAIR